MTHTEAATISDRHGQAMGACCRVISRSTASRNGNWSTLQSCAPIELQSAKRKRRVHAPWSRRLWQKCQGSAEKRSPLPFQIEPGLGLGDILTADQALPIRREEEPRRHLACQVRAESLDDRVDALPALPDEEHAHVVHAKAVLVNVGTEGRAIGNQLPQDERLLKPRAHDRHGAAVDL